ncbi:MAG: Clp protease ClpP [Fusobacteriales bacterium]|nr:MAG: Clp protease ClpP [Fusobacteriales bacterium]
MINQFFNSAKKQGNKLCLKILTPIGKTNWWEDTTSSKNVIEYLEEFGKVDEIEVLINSPGGSVVEGCAIYEALKMHEAKVTIKIIGECCSIATVIAMAGDEIEMGNTAIFMIHDPIAYLGGDAKVFRDMADLLDKLKENIINAYTTKTNLSREKISEMMSGTKYMNANEAKEFGFITKIMNNSGEIKNVESSLARIENYKYKEPSNFRKGEIMNRDELKSKHPELFQQILNEGGAIERERIQNLEKLEEASASIPENLALIKKAKFEDIKNKSDIIEELYLNQTKAKNITLEAQAGAIKKQETEIPGINFSAIKTAVNEELGLPPGNSETDTKDTTINLNLDDIANLSENNKEV